MVLIMSATSRNDLTNQDIALSKIMEGHISSKRTLRIPKVLSPVDSDLLIYPRGVVTALKETVETSPPVKRIELFAEDSKETFGILRTLSVAFSSERTLLEMAQASDSIIQVRSVSNSSSSSADDTGRRIVEDRMVLKRMESQSEPMQYTAKTPDLHVSGQWLEKFDLELGERVIVSNPIEKYVVPPPSISSSI